MSELTEKHLDYIGDGAVKKLLLQDSYELKTCMQYKLWKAAIVLIGSLIEASLYYHIENTDTICKSIENFEKRDIGLNFLLQVAKKHKIVREELCRLSEPIRDYRNLIHPRGVFPRLSP